MESSLIINKEKCPHCGISIASYNKFAPMICINCDTKIQVKEFHTTEVTSPEYIVPFRMTKEDFENFVINKLIDTKYVPVDIFERVSFNNVHPVSIYIPMFLCKGNHEASFNCSVGYMEKQLIDLGKNIGGEKLITEKNVIKYQPFSGKAKNKFDILCPAYEGRDITPELANFTQTFAYDPAYIKKFDPRYLKDKDTLVLPNNLDKNTAWLKKGESLINTTAEKDAAIKIQPDIIKDFSVANIEYNIKQDNILVYIPFWFIHFQYDDTKYHILMDGIGKSYDVVLPCDNAKKALIKKWENTPTYFKFGKWVIAITLAVTINIIVAVIAFVVIWIGQLILTSVAKSKIDEIHLSDYDTRERSYRIMA